MREGSVKVVDICYQLCTVWGRCDPVYIIRSIVRMVCFPYGDEADRVQAHTSNRIRAALVDRTGPSTAVGRMVVSSKPRPSLAMKSHAARSAST